MPSLTQRIKDLDSRSFEELCLSLLKAKHPEARIQRVDGAGGDDGVDILVGAIDERPIVWQCKAFPNGVRAAQKQQIRESLATAVRKVSPRIWILCISTDLTVGARRWFDDLVKRHGFALGIRLWQASDIAYDLSHYRTVLKTFFPGELIDVDELRSLMAGTADTSDDALRMRGIENLQQFIDRMKIRDGRFEFSVTVAPDQSQARPIDPRCVFSVRNGATIVDALARDMEALTDSPPTLRLTMLAEAGQRLDSAIDQGRSVEVRAGELLEVQTDLPFTDELREHAGEARLTITPRSKPGIVPPLRLTFGSDGSPVVYEYVEFEVVRPGRKEFEIRSISELPFELRICLNGDQGCSCAIQERAIRHDVRAVRKFMDALHAMNRSRCFSAYNLKEGRSYFRARTSEIAIPKHWPSGFEPFIRRIAEILDYFGVPDLMLPEHVTGRDEETLKVLDSIRTGNPVPVSNLIFQADKVDGHDEQFTRDLRSGRTCSGELRQEYSPTLFGHVVPVGPIRIEFDLPFANVEETIHQWMNAAVGEPVTFQTGAGFVRFVRETAFKH